MSKALELTDKLDRQLTMSMFAKREDLYAQMEKDREDASIAIKSLIAQLEAAKKQMESQKDQWLSWEEKRRGLEKDSEELAAIRALEPVAWMDEKSGVMYWHDTHEVDKYHGFDPTVPLVALPEQKK